jgi:hypothetical protein
MHYHKQSPFQKLTFRGGFSKGRYYCYKEKWLSYSLMTQAAICVILFEDKKNAITLNMKVGRYNYVNP